MLLNQHRGVETQKVHGNERPEYEGQRNRKMTAPVSAM